MIVLVERGEYEDKSIVCIIRLTTEEHTDYKVRLEAAEAALTDQQQEIEKAQSLVRVDPGRFLKERDLAEERRRKLEQDRDAIVTELTARKQIKYEKLWIP